MAAKAGFSRSTGTRLKADPERIARPKAQRARRRPDPLAAIFEADVVPILEVSDDIGPVSALRQLLEDHPDLDPGVRRTLERRIRHWRAGTTTRSCTPVRFPRRIAGTAPYDGPGIPSRWDHMCSLDSTGSERHVEKALSTCRQTSPTIPGIASRAGPTAPNMTSKPGFPAEGNIRWNIAQRPGCRPGRYGRS